MKSSYTLLPTLHKKGPEKMSELGPENEGVEGVGVLNNTVRGRVAWRHSFPHSPRRQPMATALSHLGYRLGCTRNTRTQSGGRLV